MHNKIKSTTSFWSETLNTTKALLILLVILGHLMSGNNPISHYILYITSSINMPLFFGISGFLLKKELFYQPFSQLSSKYFHRLIIPYVFAYITFSLLQETIINPLYPWFHLWFVPAFLLMIVYLYIIEYFNINRTGILLISFIFTSLWLAFFQLGESKEILYFLGNKRYYYNFVFLYFGYMLRNYSQKTQIPLWLIFTLVLSSGFYLFIINNNHLVTLFYSLHFVLFNLALIYLLVYYTLHFKNIRIPLISSLGSITLPIYLWHIAPLLLLWRIRELYDMNGILYYLVYLIFLILLVKIIYILNKTQFGKIFITGTYK